MEKFKTKAYGATGTLLVEKKLEPMEVEREKPKADEVLIEILYCGVCHSDIHQVNNDWKNTIYPCVPGHEIIGKIMEAGADATEFKVGQVVGIGCMIDSCGECSSCNDGEEQFCLGPHGTTMTYNGYFKPDGSGYNTFGGFSTHLVSKKDFVLTIPEKLDIKSAAPILCAGVTMYSPLKHANVKAGDKVGIIGIGGLGHMGIMLAKAMGAEVTAITTSKEKREAAFALGADSVLISEDSDAMEEYANKFNFLLCTIPSEFDINPYIQLLKPRGNMMTVGLLGAHKEPTNNMEMAKFARSAGGSFIGGIAETQEVLDFCAEHNILPQTKMISINELNDAFDNIKDEDVRFRYVIDMATLKAEEAA
jgi:uncharacterized zinc-type alcohol dehydrogenase-like protein